MERYGWASGEVLERAWESVLKKDDSVFVAWLLRIEVLLSLTV